MTPNVSRRGFLAASALTVSSVSAAGLLAQEQISSAASSISVPQKQESTFSWNGDSVRFFVPGLKESSKVLHITDTHIFLDDERGEPFRRYSKRMAAGYHQTSHFRTSQPTTPMESFEAALRFAREKKVDAVTLTGDILSFPSEAGRDWLLERLAPLKKDGIPYYYISGNHDWHYEGMSGSDIAKRNEWIPKRLTQLYPQGADPLKYAVTEKGIRHLFIDDSVYEILPEQLEFLKQELAKGEPTVVWMHIPPYAPGRGIGYGCGHPKWGAESDKSWKIEGRERWREGGHQPVTFEFYQLLCTAPNLLGTMCGHTHTDTLDIVGGKPFTVTQANARGAWRLVEFLPRDFD